MTSTRFVAAALVHLDAELVGVGDEVALVGHGVLEQLDVELAHACRVSGVGGGACAQLDLNGCWCGAFSALLLLLLLSLCRLERLCSGLGGNLRSGGGGAFGMLVADGVRGMVLEGIVRGELGRGCNRLSGGARRRARARQVADERERLLLSREALLFTLVVVVAVVADSWTEVATALLGRWQLVVVGVVVAVAVDVAHVCARHFRSFRF